MKKLSVILILVAVVLSAYNKASNAGFNVPDKWPQPVYDFKNSPLSKDKVDLGRVLFYDPLLSRNNTISCASCHSSYNAFAHTDHGLSHGIEDRIGKRNAPALMNLAWQRRFMWDGSIHHLDAQSLAPITNPDEMGEQLGNVVNKLQASPLYRKLFLHAYGDTVVTGERTLKALAQFMLTIVSANAKYDRVVAKQETFTPQEQNGYRLFQQNCASCHREPLFTNGDFACNGLPTDTTLNDVGRVAVTNNTADSFRFKVPTLRNIEYSFPYMHDGRFKTLAQVINHYTKGMAHTKFLSKELQKPIVLTSNDKVDLVAFLLTLSDKEFLFNPAYGYPKDILAAAKD